MLVTQSKAQLRRLHGPQHGIHGWHDTPSLYHDACPCAKVARHLQCAALASWLRDEERDPPGGPRLVLRVWRIRRDSEIPEPPPLGLVFDLAHPHRLYCGMVADLDGRVGAQVVHPDRVRWRSTHGPDEDIVGAILDAHQRSLADRAGFVTGVSHDDHRQPGVAEGSAFGPTTALVELDLVAHPLPGTGDILCHGPLLDTGNVRSAYHDQLKSQPSFSYRRRHETSQKRRREPSRTSSS